MNEGLLVVPDRAVPIAVSLSLLGKKPLHRQLTDRAIGVHVDLCWYRNRPDIRAVI